jgi:hypothetical protein
VARTGAHRLASSIAILTVGLASLGAVEGPQATLIAHRSQPLPRNTHLFVRERWRSTVPPNTSFALKKKDAASEVPLEDRVQPLEDGRMHELVPAVSLDAKSTYELVLTSPPLTQTFSIQIGDALDDKPPVWDEVNKTAHDDDSALGPIYIVWKPGTDGLVDVDGLATDVMMSLEKVGSEGYVAVQVVDFAGHRLEPRELNLGGPVENPSLRRARLAAKRASQWSRENPMPILVGFLSIFLIVYVYVKRKRHFA